MKKYVKLLYFQFLRGVMAKTKLYIFYMSPYGAPTKHVVKMAPLVVTCMPSSNLKRTKHLPHTFTKEGLLQLPG